MRLKKAAMFGLDARIALAIFSALSVISGAALYSAIQNAKATALITEMNEIGKAWEQYMLDTGNDLPKGADASGKHRIVNKLVSDTVAGWQGPYLPFPVATGSGFTEYLDHPKYGLLTLVSTSKLDWGMGNAAANWASAQCDDSATLCYLTVQLSDFTGKEITISLLNNIDDRIDGGDGSAKGSIRWFETAPNTRTITYHYAPHKMPQ